MISTSSFGPFDSKAWYFQHCFDGGGLQACVPWRVPPANILSVGSRFCCQQLVVFLLSSKPCLARMFAGVPFFYCLFSAIFKL
jgi:hypothetical protein